MAIVNNAEGSDLGISVESFSSAAKENENRRVTAPPLQNGHLIAGTVLRPHQISSFLAFESKMVQPPPSEMPNDGEREMRDLEELLSKLNPMAEEFVPHVNHGSWGFGSGGGIVPGFYSNGFGLPGVYPNGGCPNGGYRNDGNGNGGRRRKNGHGQGRKRMNSRTGMAQRDEMIRRTVYVSDIDQQVTEEDLAALFVNCGQVVDCRACGDPNSVLRFAFIEFTDEEGAQAALSLSGTMLGFYPVRVLPSKTAIAPVDPKFLPRSEDEREMCSRTIYCTNIDNKVSQSEVKLFFERICGPVYRLRLLGDYHHATRIAFVEFAGAESAIAALNCSGAILGSLPLRVSPSKTPVRPRPTRAPMTAI